MIEGPDETLIQRYAQDIARRSLSAPVRKSKHRRYVGDRRTSFVPPRSKRRLFQDETAATASFPASVASSSPDTAKTTAVAQVDFAFGPIPLALRKWQEFADFRCAQRRQKPVQFRSSMIDYRCLHRNAPHCPYQSDSIWQAPSACPRSDRDTDSLPAFFFRNPQRVVDVFLGVQRVRFKINPIRRHPIAVIATASASASTNGV